MNEGLRECGDGKPRCWWCGDDDLYQSYHDGEWGFPVDDDVRLFEKICLEGFQSGLSWLTILRKREGFRRAFRGFEPEVVARFNRRSVERLLGDAAIVRHRGKIESTINNARRVLELQEEVGSLARHVWSFAPPSPPRSFRMTKADLMARTQSPESVALSKDLKARGWTFVGPTTAYAFMQSMGMVNDHLHGCTVQASVARARRIFNRP